MILPHLCQTVKSEAHSVVTMEDNTVIIDVFNPVRLDHLANHK
jgi:hypothetical protein